MLLLDPDARVVIAHRGDSAFAPENTMEAFGRAVALGAHALEFDCRLSADGVAVVVHDADLDRTTDARGPVRALTAAALGRVDAGARFVAAPVPGLAGSGVRPYAGGGLGIPTLDQVLEAFPQMPLLIEVKEFEACDAVRAALDRHSALGRVVVASFRDDATAYFKATPYPTGAGQGDVAALLRAALIGGRVSPGYEAASVPPTYRGLPLPVRRFARLLRPAGVPVHVWTVDDGRSALRLWEGGVSGIVSNDPGAVLDALRGATFRPTPQ